jgi:putative tryptophan/tyrosine transport system substrate-binding protein
MRRRADLLLPACGEKVGMRGPFRWAQNRGKAPSPAALGATTSPRAAGRGEIRRRSFLALLGGAVALAPLAAHAQSPPVIGFLAQGTPEATAAFVAAVRDGLADTGLVEGTDYTSEFRSARGDADRLPGLAAELVQRRVAVIMVLDTGAAVRAAKLATTQIPIVFVLGYDPVKAGFVASLNQPGGNITGISTMSLEIGPKWVGLLHELLPAAKRIAVLVNIENADGARFIIANTQEAGFSIGLQTEIVFAGNEDEIAPALAGLGARAQALLIQPDVFFRQHFDKLAALAIREKLPAVFSDPVFAQAGGLMSYGWSYVEAHRPAGVYVGRILKGEKPGDLPVQQATKFDFVLNLKTAKAIGLDIPPTLLARADEVIE